MSVVDEETVTIECRAGHSWTIPRPKRGKWPEYCPDHKRFFLEQLSGRVKPPYDQRQEWAEQGKMLGDDGYLKRWEKFWVKTVRMVGAKGMSWNAVDIEQVKKYVRSVRMAELHRLYAQDEPYIRTAHGKVQPHPGFELAKEAEAEAHKVAVGLGLAEKDEPKVTDAPVPKPKPEARKPAADYFNTRFQEEAEDIGEVEHPTGPDGEAL